MSRSQLQTEPRGLLEVRLHIDAAYEDELNDWYDSEHVPELLGIPGVLSATRYTEVTDGRRMHRAFYELANAEVISSKEFHRLLAQRTPWSRRMYSLYDNEHRIRYAYTLMDSKGRSSPFDGRWLYCFKTDVAPGMEAEFNNSYDEELLEALASVEGCVGARRFVVLEGRQKYMALYGLTDLEVVHSKPWLAAANTGRRIMIRAHLQHASKCYCELLRPTVRK